MGLGEGTVDWGRSWVMGKRVRAICGMGGDAYSKAVLYYTVHEIPSLVEGGDATTAASVS